MAASLSSKRSAQPWAMTQNGHYSALGSIVAGTCYDRLNVEIAGEAGVFLDVVEAQLGAPSHQRLDEPFGAGEPLVRGFDCGRVDARREDDAEERALGRVHRRLAQVARRHLAEPLEAADLDLATAVERGCHQLFAMCVVAGVLRHLALGQPGE